MSNNEQYEHYDHEREALRARGWHEKHGWPIFVDVADRVQAIRDETARLVEHEPYKLIQRYQPQHAPRQPTVAERFNRMSAPERYEIRSMLKRTMLRRTIRQVLSDAYLEGSMRRRYEQAKANTIAYEAVLAGGA